MDDFELMMEKMLGAPIPVALGRHPTDLIPYAYVTPPGIMWHLDPQCERLDGQTPVKLVDLIPPPDDIGDYFPNVDACVAFRGDVFAGEQLMLNCMVDEKKGMPVTLYPCERCVVARDR